MLLQLIPLTRYLITHVQVWEAYFRSDGSRHGGIYVGSLHLGDSKVVDGCCHAGPAWEYDVLEIRKLINCCLLWKVEPDKQLKHSLLTHNNTRFKPLLNHDACSLWRLAACALQAMVEKYHKMNSKKMLNSIKYIKMVIAENHYLLSIFNIQHYKKEGIFEVSLNMLMICTQLRVDYARLC